MKDIKVIMTFARSTKGTHLYATDKSDAPMTSLYIKKHGLPEIPPGNIVVTVSINGSDE